MCARLDTDLPRVPIAPCQLGVASPCNTVFFTSLTLVVGCGGVRDPRRLAIAARTLSPPRRGVRFRELRPCATSGFHCWLFAGTVLDMEDLESTGRDSDFFV